MLHRTLLAFIFFVILLRDAQADGFKLVLETNRIVGQNTEGITPDQLFGHNFDLVNNLDGTYESSHGSVDGNDPGSGFNFPTGGPTDSFQYNIRGLWTYQSDEAVPAPNGMVLDLLKASNGDLLAHIDGPLATPLTFNIAATSTHELIWSVSQTAPFDVWGLVFTIAGRSAATGLPFEESAPFVVVQWTPNFVGNPETPMQAILAAALALPGDFNRDGMVDAADYTVWRDGLGSTHTPLQYEVWRSHFGEPNGGSGAGSEFSAVPEPGGLAAALSAAILLTTLRPASRKMRGRTSEFRRT